MVLGASPPNSARRRRNTENSESNEDIDTESRHRGRRGSFICSRIKQVVEVVNFSTKGDDRTIHCGKCIGKILVVYKARFLAGDFPNEQNSNTSCS